MSAFFVSPETVADTVAVLMEYGSNLPTHNRKQLGQALWQMNAQALVERYGDDDGEYGNQIEAYAAPKASANPYQRAQSAQCFAYQCCEGVVPETDLFKLVDNAVVRAVEALGGPDHGGFGTTVWGR